MVIVGTGTGASTKTSRAKVFRNFISFDARVFLGFASCSGLLGLIMLGRTFFRKEELYAIFANQSLVLFKWVSPNRLANPLGL